MVSLDSPKTFEVVEAVLAAKRFTQLGLSKQVGASFGIVNRTCQWLEAKNFVKRVGKAYELRDAPGILSSLAVFRDMNALALDEVMVSLQPEQVKDLLSSKRVCYCLETALEQYSNYFRANRVCAYADKKTVAEALKLLRDKQGQGLQVVFFEEKPPIKNRSSIESRDYTDKTRTVIDLVCDNKAFLAQDLFKELWGASLA